MNTKPLIEQKRRAANVWIALWNTQKDNRLAMNACMAIGRYAGVIELACNLFAPDDPYQAEFKEALDQALHAYNAITEGNDVATL